MKKKPVITQAPDSAIPNIEPPLLWKDQARAYVKSWLAVRMATVTDAEIDNLLEYFIEEIEPGNATKNPQDTMTYSYNPALPPIVAAKQEKTLWDKIMEWLW